MKNNSKIEILTSSILIVLTVLLLNPFNFWMPGMMHIVVLTLTVAVFAVFALFVLREKVQDEREVIHRMLAGRVAFTTGSALLTLGIVTQAIHDNVDVWLVVVLVAMVLSKLVTRIYTDRRL
ncbi:MAG: hypothetical protein LR008_01140 [Candidatus Pacebacteria bacterium]|nr:hypothetical protein [Candidatus Paceibacterota bacterium]